MADWNALADEFDAWYREDRPATLWWRDDDATQVTPALDRLLAISRTTGTPMALAVIPSDADRRLRDHLARQPLVVVLQHGWSHENHAPDGERQQEFGIHRPLAEMLDDLARGRACIARFERSLPVLVAPWNRMDPHLLPHLASVDLAAVSTLGPRQAAEPFPGIRRTNVHVDIMDWHGTGGFVGLDRAIGQFLTHLGQRRRGEVDADEPTGLMTHHLYHDDACWWFVEQLLERTRAHLAVRWLGAAEAFQIEVVGT